MIGDNFFFLNSVESTNNYAISRAHAGLAKHGDVFLAEEQTAGKGQRGKSWEAAPGENITLSVILEMHQLLFSRQFMLSAAIALGCHDFLTKKLETDVKIKWPNDLYWRDRKAAGILIENILQGTQWKFAIAGVGININQSAFSKDIQAVSLKQITGKQWDVKALAAELCQSLEDRWNQLLNNDFAGLMHDYNHCLYKKDQRVKLKKDNIGFETVIREVNKEGELITQDVGTHYYKSGEVQWII